MKKHILLKTVLLFVFSIFLLQGCREELVAIENQNIKTNISHKNFSDFSTNKSLINEINKIKSIVTKSKFDKSSQDILNVNLNDALFIEDATNNKHSYIFKIANNSYDIKNLVLANNSSGNYDAYLVNYSLSKEERNLFVSGHNVDMRNKTSITPIDKNKINFNSKTSGTCYELIKYQEDCFCHTTHASGGCTHPDTVYDLIEVPCTGGSTTGDTGTGDQGGTTYGTGSNSTGTGGSYIPNVLITPNGEPIEILANSINSILEMALSGNELLWLNSNTDFAEGIWNMLSNNSSTETKNFAQWGITFASNNNISWTQFQNWFVEGDQDFNRDLLKMIVENNHKIPQYTSSDFPGMNNGMPYNWWNDENYLNNMSLGFNNINLTKEEKKMCALFPLAAVMIFSNKDIALNEASSTFPNQIPHNNKADAFRHAFFNALNTRDVYSQFSTRGTFTFAKNIVRMFGIAHESEVPQELLLEKAMDLYNNERGIEVCSTCNPLTNPTNLVKGYVLSLLNEGKLVHIWPLNNDQTIRPDSNIYPTNQH